MITKKLGLLDVKQAIYDDRFRALFPELKDDMDRVLKDPGCSCNREVYVKFFQYPDRLKKFFPARAVDSFEQESKKLGENHWQVINCHIDRLEGVLKKLTPSGKVQLAVARYEDQVTVVVNHLEVTY